MPEYSWYLTRFAGINNDGPVGSIVGPSADLGEGLTVQSVLEVLNSGNAFDFGYTPAENDSLRISRSVKNSYYQYMSFLYKNGQWSVGMNPPFKTMSEDVAKGNVFN